MNRKPGLILINKPAGITSFKLLSPIKRLYETKKVGHAGTLDKFASGLMLVCVNQGTRMIQYLTGEDKEYIGEIRFGTQTSTLDPEGDISKECGPPGRADFEAIIPRFVGEIDQVPPQFSAIHIDGKRAYKRVLSGEQPEMPTRRVTIAALELTAWREDDEGVTARIRVECSKGTYIRSLARDLAEACGSCGHLVSLIRTRVGAFYLKDAIDISALDAMGSENREKLLLWDEPLVTRIPGFHIRQVHGAAAEAVLQGKPLQHNRELNQVDQPNEMIALVDDSRQLLALLECRDGKMKYRAVFSRLDN